MIPNPLRVLALFLDWAWPLETRPILSVLADEQLADDEAEQEVWEPTIGGLKIIRTDALPRHLDGIAFNEDAFKTSPAGGEAVTRAAATASGPPAGERPAAAIGPDSAAAGHPNIRAKSLHAAAVLGLRQWVNGEPCTARTYYALIARDLEEQFSK